MMPVLLVGFSGLFQMAFTLALIAGGVLLIGATISMAVYAYKTVFGDGVRKPEDVVPEKIDDGDGLTEGGADDEWAYY